jgi:hypothetical protein
MAIARHVETSAPSTPELLHLHRTASSSSGGLLKGQVRCHGLFVNNISFSLF